MRSLKSIYLDKQITLITILFSLLIGFANASSAAEIARKDDGSWTIQTGTNPAYWADKGFWVDATVQNLGYNKEVSLVWTEDDWVTSTTSNLSYEYTLANGYEVWGIEFSPFGRYDTYYMGAWTNYITGRSRVGGGATVKYALRYKVNGNTYWDSNSGQNYVKQF